MCPRSIIGASDNLTKAVMGAPRLSAPYIAKSCAKSPSKKAALLSIRPAVFIPWPPLPWNLNLMIKEPHLIIIYDDRTI